MGKLDRIDFSKDVSLTQQSAKEETDINFIVERAKRGADISHVNPREPMYGDFTVIPRDLRECLVMVKKADEAFMALDASVRKRFDNDSSLMIDFLNDPVNRAEAVKLGLVKAPVVPVVDPVVEQLSGLRADLRESSGARKAKAKPDAD